MTGRELFLLGKRLLVVILGGKFLVGCQWLRTLHSAEILIIEKVWNEQISQMMYDYQYNNKKAQ